MESNCFVEIQYFNCIFLKVNFIEKIEEDMLLEKLSEYSEFEIENIIIIDKPKIEEDDDNNDRRIL